MSDVSFYDILGVKEDATTEEIKTAYRRAARANHPDSGMPGAGALFPMIQSAWDTLGNQSKRSEYDRKRSNPRASQNTSSTPRYEPPRTPNASEEAAERARNMRAREAQQWLDDNPRTSSPPEDHVSLQQQRHEDLQAAAKNIKKLPRRGIVMISASSFLWILWTAICCWLIAGIGKDGVIFAFVAFFLTLGMTFLLVRFSRNLAAVYAFIFAAITLPLPVAGLVTAGFSSTSLIFVVTAVGIASAFGDHFLRRPVTAYLFKKNTDPAGSR